MVLGRPTRGPLVWEVDTRMVECLGSSNFTMLTFQDIRPSGTQPEAPPQAPPLTLIPNSNPNS